MERTWNRVAGACGLLFILGIVVGFLGVAGAPGAMIDASRAEVARHVAEANTTRVLLGECLEVLGFLFLLVFGARLCELFRRADRNPGFLALAAFGSLLVVTASSVVGIVALAPAHWRQSEPLSPTLATAFNDLRVFGHFAELGILGFFLVLVGVLALRTHVLPRTLAWGATAIGIAQIATVPLAPNYGVLDKISLLMMVWIAATSVVLLVRRPQALPQDALALAH